MRGKLKRVLMALERRLVRVRGKIRRHGFYFSTEHPRMHPDILRALEHGAYEAGEIDMIRRYVTTEDRVLEIGICLGVTSLIISGIVDSNDLLLYEADAENYDMARCNFDLNNKALTMHHRVLFSGPDRPETVTFYASDGPSSASLIHRKESREAVDVKTHALEDVLRDFAPTLICADIEGGEIDLFGKCDDFGSVRTILLETHARVTGQAAVDGMVKHLTAQGFKVVEQHGGDFFVFARPGST